MKQPGAMQRGSAGARLGFRAKLTIAMMLVVSLVTGLALYLAQRNAQTTYEKSLQDQFKASSGPLFVAQDSIQMEVAQRCRSLARSVRIRAALEDNYIEGLYGIARDELRGVLADPSAPDSGNPGTTPRATFFCFLDPAGKILPPPKGFNVEPWETRIEKAGIGSRGAQQIGYVEGPQGISEIVTTPMIGSDGEMLAALVLGFPFVEAKASGEIKTGIWSRDLGMYVPGMPAADRGELSSAIAGAIDSAAGGDGNFPVRVGGAQYQLFYKLLNPGSHYTQAYDVSLYSLEPAQAQLRLLQWKIVGVGLAVLALGLGASNLFSASLSKPVEQLAEDSAQNVALREQAETELELTEQKYRSIFENAVEGIFLLAPDGRYLSANPAMARIFGYDSPAQFVAGANGPEQSARSGPGAYKEFLWLTEANDVVSNFETRMMRRDGTEIWVSQNVRVVRDAGGKLLHFEGTLEDITERKRAVDSLHEVNAELEKAVTELKTTQQQVIQQERLRALGQMASGIAHDFNNALMPITGFAELLLLNPAVLDDRKKASSYIEIISTAAADATSIVARLREFYRTNERSDIFTQIDLKKLVQQTIALTQPKWKNQAQANGAEIHIAEALTEVGPIAGDESALREVLTNLIFNAVDAMPRGGTLTLRTIPADGRAMIEVADTGSGMGDEVRARCMEPFFSTKGERGTGLGLAMVFGIVQRHEGKIDIRTKQGEGTTFAISFPVREAAPKAEVCAGACQARSLRVLVVDDEPQVRQVLTALLETEGHKVQTANDGVDGLRCFLDSKFDLVITDKAMPGMSGDQMAVAIRQFSSTMPIVLLTGFHNTKDNAELTAISVIANKPITMPELRETIDKAMRAA